jgi:hypothetical protein
MHDDAASSLPGTVEKIIKPIQGEAEKAQIAIQSGYDPKQKIRIANILVDARGEAVSLKRGAAVQIVVRPKRKTQFRNRAPGKAGIRAKGEVGLKFDVRVAS